MVKRRLIQERLTNTDPMRTGSSDSEQWLMFSFPKNVARENPL